MKKIFTKLTVALAAITSVSFAQQDPQFTQFMHNKLIYNPGYAGTSQAICTNVLYRQQWVNFPGAPKTGLISFDMPLPNLPLGIGLNVMNDQIGFSKTLFARLALAYNRPIGAGMLGVGIDGGILQQQFNGNWITPDGNNVADASIPGYQAVGSSSANAKLNQLTYDLGFGAYYTIPNKMYVGLSSTHLTAQDITAGGKVKYSLARHYYLMAGYTFNLNAPEHTLTPNIKVKSDAASTQVDVNLTYMYNNTFWLGVSYRLQDAIAPMLGVRLLEKKNLKIGYSYDVTTSKIKGYSAGTHEIMLGYCFNVVQKVKISSYGSVRQLD